MYHSLISSRWFSLARASQSWIAPAHGNALSDIASDTVICSFLNHKGQHLVMLAVSGIHGVLSALKAESGSLVVQVRCTYIPIEDNHLIT